VTENSLLTERQSCERRNRPAATVEKGAMDEATLEAISRPLITEKAHRRFFNQMS